ncbi:MAG: sigma-70 family RNA polymerase sigma factor [Planctomycetota bacterium]
MRTDNELMLRVQAGDLEAFAQLVERFQSMVHGLAMSILRRPEDAEEAAQDTFLKLFRARGQFDGTRSLEPWLLRIAGNACRDKLRRRRVGELPLTRLDDFGQMDRDPLLEVADQRQAIGTSRLHVDHSVRSELEQLSDKVRMPLELKYLRGLTNQQIASSLGISVSNVKVQLARGKDILASRLQGVKEA